ncbi:hypothetical protein KSS87_018840, partial [Heliosperma pusillum]
MAISYIAPSNGDDQEDDDDDGKMFIPSNIQIIKAENYRSRALPDIILPPLSFAPTNKGLRLSKPITSHHH